MKDSNPFLATIFVLSFTEGIMIYYIVEVGWAMFYKELIVSNVIFNFFTVIMLMFTINAYVFHIKKRATVIIETKPLLFNSQKGSIIFAIFWFLFSCSLMFLATDWIYETFC